MPEIEGRRLTEFGFADDAKDAEVYAELAGVPVRLKAASAGGLATLDGDAKMPVDQLPVTVADLRPDLESTASDKGAALIRWLSTAAGAVQRLLSDKLGEQPLTPEDFGALGDGVTNDYAALNLAMVAAVASKARTLKLTAAVYAFASTLVVPVGLKIVGRGNASDAFNGYMASSGTRLKWVGTDGGGSKAVQFKHHNFAGGGMERVTVDGNNRADICVEIDGCDGLAFDACSFISSKGVADLKLICTLSTFGDTATSCSWNTFRNLRLGSAGAGQCLWLNGDYAAGNTCHNTFQTLKIDHAGSKHGITLGNCDNNKFDMVYIHRDPSGTGHGVNVEPDNAFPIANVFNHLQAGNGGWYQPSNTLNSPATVWDYQFDNGQPYPVLNGTKLYYSTSYGFIPSELPVDATLQSAWINYGSGTQSAQYWKDRLGIVHLRGMVRSGGIPSTMFQLPVGFRPSADEYFAVDSNSAHGLVYVTASGNVIAQAGSNLWISLSGITYRADYPQS